MNIKKFVRYKKNIDKKFNRENLISIASILNNDEYFVFYGTLLGLVREKDIIENTSGTIVWSLDSRSSRR